MPTDTLQRLREALTETVTVRSAVADRFAAELAFADGLCELHPKSAAGWRKLLDRAANSVLEVLTAGRLDALPDAVESAEALLAPLAAVAKQYTIHCVGHAHIDMNWMWSWPETVAVTNDTFRTVLKLMEEFPDFCFTQSQASVYDIIRRYHPELLAEIRTRVEEGRWEVAAAHWVEGDKNLASGESLARHVLYTRAFLAEHLGLSPEDCPLDWSPDTFGHARTIPSIDARGGVKYYYLCRGGSFDKPPLFWWQGPDGARVLVYRETTWYNDSIGPHNADALLKFAKQTGLQDWMNVYGVGDHGGGPTRRDLRRAIEMNAWPLYPNFRFATAKAYLDTVAAGAGERLPVLDRELNFEFTGCYTSQSEIKKANRHGENRCLEAETVCALAHRATGRTYRTRELRDAWVNTLFGHFHDILPGSGVRDTRHYQMALFQEATARTGVETTESLRALSARVDTSFAADASPLPIPSQEPFAMGAGVGKGSEGGGLYVTGFTARGPRPVMVCNPTAHARSEVVTATLWDLGPAEEMRRKPFRARTPDGRTFAAQVVDAGFYWGHHFVTVAFPASMGPLAYACYAVEPGSAEPAGPTVQHLQRVYYSGGAPQLQCGYGLENEHVRVGFDTLTGGVTSLVDKATGVDLADPARPMALLEYALERHHGMTAWVIGDHAEIRPLTLSSFAMGLQGPYLATLKGQAVVGDSTVDVTYGLSAVSPELTVTIEANWVERGSPQRGVPSLRFVVPLALRDARGRYEIPFGSIAREEHDGQEVPALRWADVTGTAVAGADGPSRNSPQRSQRTQRGKEIRLTSRASSATSAFSAVQPGSETVAKGAAGTAGLALFNDCKYGHSLDGDTLRVSLLRSSYDPDPLPEIGKHTMRFALVPHGAPLAPADLIRGGTAFNHPLLTLPVEPHAGDLPPVCDAGVTVSPDAVVLSGIKVAEDGDGVIVRLIEAGGKAATGRVTFDAKLLGEIADVEEVDLLERPVAKGSAKRAAKNAFTVKLPKHGIASVRVRFS